jgi:hypothetical protein
MYRSDHELNVAVAMGLKEAPCTSQYTRLPHGPTEIRCDQRKLVQSSLQVSAKAKENGPRHGGLTVPERRRSRREEKSEDSER